MPKKTKKQKIIAEYHKKIQLLQKQRYPNIKTEEKISTPIKKEEIIKESIKKELLSTEAEIIIKNFFYQDFKKSFILIATIVALEFFLYFATIKNYLRLGY